MGARSRIAILALLTLALSAILAFHRLGASSLFGDEAIFANLARNIVVENQWYPIDSGGERYVSKPPLSLWPMALRYKVAGVSELNTRIGSALGGVLASMLLFALGTWLLDETAGAIAALLLITAPPWLLEHGVREGVGDVWTTLFTGLALFAYTRGRIVVAILAAAAGSLIKGPVVFLVLFSVGLLWELTARLLQGRRPRWLLLCAVVLASAIPFALWLLDNARDPIARAKLWAQFISRHTQAIDPTHIHERSFYLRVVAGAFGWWLFALLLPLLWKWLKEREVALLLPVWAFVPISVFSLSVSRLPWYVDPALPPLAMMIGIAVSLAIAHVRSSSMRSVLAALVIVAMSSRVVAAWNVVHAAPRLTDMHRVALAYRTATHPALYVDDLRTGTYGFREWNYVYLNQLPRTTPIPAVIDRSRCSVVVTLHPEPLLRRADFTGAETTRLRKHDPREEDLSLIDLCNGHFTRALR